MFFFKLWSGRHDCIFFQTDWNSGRDPKLLRNWCLIYGSTLPLLAYVSIFVVSRHLQLFWISVVKAIEIQLELIFFTDLICYFTLRLVFFDNHQILWNSSQLWVFSPFWFFRTEAIFRDRSFFLLSFSVWSERAMACNRAQLFNFIMEERMGGVVVDRSEWIPLDHHLFVCTFAYKLSLQSNLSPFLVICWLLVYLLFTLFHIFVCLLVAFISTSAALLYIVTHLLLNNK